MPRKAGSALPASAEPIAVSAQSAHTWSPSRQTSLTAQLTGVPPPGSVVQGCLEEEDVLPAGREARVQRDRDQAQANYMARERARQGY